MNRHNLKNSKIKLFALNTPWFARNRQRKHLHFRAFFVSPVRLKQGHLFYRCLLATGMLRAVCPVKCEALFNQGAREASHDPIPIAVLLLGNGKSLKHNNAGFFSVSDIVA